jgi:hypothetical protein
VPESIIRAALLRRAVEDIHRIIQIRTAKQACSTLLQRGSVGDDLWQRFLRAEKEMEEELRDVVMEVSTSITIKAQYVLIKVRPTHSHQTGANQSFNLRTKLLRILSSESDWMRFKPRPNQKSNGGRNGEPQSSPSS